MSSDTLSILGLCLVTAVICTVLKPKSGEYALLTAAAAGIIIGILLLERIYTPINTLRQELNTYGIKTEYFKVALKGVGIGYVTSFIADACRDCGQSSLALKAEFAGKCAIFILSVPLLISVLQTAVGFLK